MDKKQPNRFLKNYKHKISAINKEGHIGVVKNASNPIQKIDLKSSRNIENGIKIGLLFNSQKTNNSRNLKGFLQKLRSKNGTKFEEIQSHHKLHVSKAHEFLDPNTINSILTKATDHTTSK